MTMQKSEHLNRWFCQTCKATTEHKEVKHGSHIYLVCVNCGHGFPAPKRFSYMKGVRKGGVVSLRRIHFSRMGMREKGADKPT